MEQTTVTIRLRPDEVKAFIEADGTTATGLLGEAVNAMRAARRTHETTERGDTILLREFACSRDVATALRARARGLGEHLPDNDDYAEARGIFLKVVTRIDRALR
jgi:hypothetical protein